MTELIIRDLRGGRYGIDTIFVKGGWSAVVGVYGLGVYNILAMHADNTTQDGWPSYQTIADYLGCSRRQVIRATNDLKQLNVIEVEERYRTDGGQTSNLITLLHQSQWKPPKALVAIRGKEKAKKAKASPPSAPQSSPKDPLPPVTGSPPPNDSRSPKLIPVELDPSLLNNDDISILLSFFARKTGMAPRGLIESQTWEDDIKDIHQLTGNQLRSTKALIEEAIQQLAGNKKYVITGPGSYFVACRTILGAKLAECQHNGGGELTPEQQAGLEALRREAGIET